MLVNTHYIEKDMLLEEMHISWKGYNLARQRRMDGAPWPSDEYRAWSELENMALSRYAELREQLEYQEKNPEKW